jgi:hypothetical protein
LLPWSVACDPSLETSIVARGSFSEATSPRRILPTGETLIGTTAVGLFAVSPEGHWRKVEADASAEPQARGPWIHVQEHELLVRSEEAAVTGRASVGDKLRAGETIGLLQPSGRATADDFLGRATHLAIRQGAKAYDEWRSSVGADDFSMLPEPQKAAAMAHAHPPPPRDAGMLQVRLSARGALRAQRVSLVLHDARPSAEDGAPGTRTATADSFGAVNPVVQSTEGDLAFVLHDARTRQAQADAVYWIAAPAAGQDAELVPIEPIAVFPGQVGDLTLFRPGSDDASLCFTVVDGDRLRIVVAQRRGVRVAKAVPVPSRLPGDRWALAGEHMLAIYAREGDKSSLSVIAF